MEQIKVLSCSNFLVIVGSYDERQQILGASPFYMDGKIIVGVPWETNLNKKPIGTSNFPVWIDLVLVDPMLEVYTNFLLGSARQLEYATTLARLRRFVHICGCVLMDVMDKPLATQIQVNVPEVGETR